MKKVYVVCYWDGFPWFATYTLKDAKAYCEQDHAPGELKWKCRTRNKIVQYLGKRGNEPWRHAEYIIMCVPIMEGEDDAG